LRFFFSFSSSFVWKRSPKKWQDDWNGLRPLTLELLRNNFSLYI
jgi:hypothetical protein